MRIDDADLVAGQGRTRGGETVILVAFGTGDQRAGFRLSIDLRQARHGKLGSTASQRRWIGVGPPASARSERGEVEVLTLRVIEHGRIGGGHAREHGAALSLDQLEHADRIEGGHAHIGRPGLQAAQQIQHAARAMEQRNDGGPAIAGRRTQALGRAPGVCQHAGMGQQRALGKACGAGGIEEGGGVAA